MSVLLSDNTKLEIAKNDWLHLYEMKIIGERKLRSSDKWFDDCIKNHEWLNKKLGGSIFEAKCDIKPKFSEEEFKEDSSVQDYVESLNECLVDYVKLYKIDWYDVIIKGYTAGKIKPYQHILNHYKKIRGTVPYYITNYISQLFTLKSEHTVGPFNGYVYIITEPKMFSLLGHLGADEESCFNDVKAHCLDKYALGANKDTYVVICSKEKLDIKAILLNNNELIEERYADNILGRGWGWAQRSPSGKNIEAMVMSNVYHDQISHTTVQVAFIEAVKQIIPSKKPLIVIRNNEDCYIDEDEVYSNHDEIWIQKESCKEMKFKDLDIKIESDFNDDEEDNDF